jgi:hypothetical protein
MLLGALYYLYQQIMCDVLHVIGSEGRQKMTQLHDPPFSSTPEPRGLITFPSRTSTGAGMATTFSSRWTRSGGRLFPPTACGLSEGPWFRRALYCSSAWATPPSNMNKRMIVQALVDAVASFASLRPHCEKREAGSGGALAPGGFIRARHVHKRCLLVSSASRPGLGLRC